MAYYAVNYMNKDNFIAPFVQGLYPGGLTIHKPGLDYLFKKTQLPYIGEVDLSKFVTDADIKKLEQAMIKNTLPHRQTAFYGDSIATSTTEMMLAVLIGEGLSITVDGNKKAQESIEHWNDHVNVLHQSMEDVIKDIWIDNLVNPGSLWRVFVDPTNKDQRVDLQRVSMQNVVVEMHPTRGWRRFIQKSNIPKKPTNKSTFYRKHDWMLEPTEYVETFIPDEIECCLYVQLFNHSPVATVLPYLVYKKWILWFMRKFAEKFWAPFLIGYIGDPKTGYMPPTKEDQDESINATLEALRKVRDFGAAAFLGTTRVEALDTKTAKNANIYVDYLEYMNKEITYGLLSSMALREARGRTAATSDIVQQGQLRFVRGSREKISLPFKRFYSQVVLPNDGIRNVKPRDIKIGWPEVRTEEVDKIMTAVAEGAKIGAFRDAREIRKILTPIWRHIDENITDKENAALKKLFLELNSPSRAEGDKPQSRASSSASKTKK